MTDTLPPSWLALFDGERLADKISATALLSTVDEDGWPHLAFLSMGEAVAKDTHRILLTTWASSHTTANMNRTGQAVLYAAADGVVWETRLKVARLEAAAGQQKLQITGGEVAKVCRHEAPYAYLDGLASFRLMAPDETLKRWEGQVGEMRRRL